MDPYNTGTDSLDDVLIYSNYALNAFYNGQLGIELTRGQKQRKIHVKTTLHKPIAMMKVFPYTETQNVYVISPRKIIMYNKLQMEKVFYSDHYFVETLYHFDEQLVNGEPQTKITVNCSLIFTKNVPLIQKKIKDYYDNNLVNSFNRYLKPQMERWIDIELIQKAQAAKKRISDAANALADS